VTRRGQATLKLVEGSIDDRQQQVADAYDGPTAASAKKSLGPMEGGGQYLRHRLREQALPKPTTRWRIDSGTKFVPVFPREPSSHEQCLLLISPNLSPKNWGTVL
jgi:hypothetical protein